MPCGPDKWSLYKIHAKRPPGIRNAFVAAYYSTSAMVSGVSTIAEHLTFDEAVSMLRLYGEPTETNLGSVELRGCLFLLGNKFDRAWLNRCCFAVFVD